MSKLRIALLQMNAVELDIDKNTEIADQFCREAARLGAHLAIFPEMFSIAYPSMVSDLRKYWQEIEFQGKEPDEKLIAKYRSYAIDDNHPYVTHFRKLAATLDMGIAVTYLSRGKKFPCNTVLIVDRHGQDIIKYSKVHLFAPNIIDAICEAGEKFFVGELDTQVGSLKIGALICADRDVPEPARILMKKGAELVIICNASPLEGLGGIVTALTKVRAYENAMAIAITNYPEPRKDGHSTAFNPDGTVLFRADGKEGAYIVEYDLERIRQYRETTMQGDAFREECYFEEILGGPILSPFKGRKNAIGETPSWYLRQKLK